MLHPLWMSRLTYLRALGVSKVSTVLHAARRIPFSVLDKVKNELDKMTKLDQVDQPSEWVNKMVMVENKNGEVRIFLDSRDLNKAIMRERERERAPSHPHLGGYCLQVQQPEVFLHPRHEIWLQAHTSVCREPPFDCIQHTFWEALLQAATFRPALVCRSI